MWLSINYHSTPSPSLRTNYISLCKFLSLFVLFFLTTTCIASPPLVITTSVGPPESNESDTGLYDLILREAFSRINQRIDIEHLPSERALMNADSELTDGEFPRISGLDKLYPNLIQVPERLTDYEFVAFSNSKYHRIKMFSWDALQPYNVAIVRGWKILEKNIVNTRSLLRVKSQKLLFELLKNDRTDLIVYSRITGDYHIRLQGLEGVKALEPPLAVRKMYLYLNKKHEKIIEPLAQALRDMRKDGTYTEIKTKALEELSVIDND
jgi:polar amino acid transport system substrate-binding protein